MHSVYLYTSLNDKDPKGDIISDNVLNKKTKQNKTKSLQSEERKSTLQNVQCCFCGLYGCACTEEALSVFPSPASQLSMVGNLSEQSGVPFLH